MWGNTNPNTQFPHPVISSGDSLRGPIEFHIKIDSDNTLAAPFLAERTDLPLSQIKLAMQKGAVWLSDKNGVNRIRRAKKALAKGTTLHFYFDQSILNAEISRPKLISDEEAYSVWFKPRGVLCQGSKWGDHCTIHRWIESNDPKQRPSMVVHRLDRAACGLIVIAHSKKMIRNLAGLFEQRLIEKIYKAIVCGEFPDHAEPVTINSAVDGRHACSNIKRLEYCAEKNLSLLEVHIETGRKHQIRRHLSEHGFPIQGDRLYGGGDSFDLQLAAVFLQFKCPLTTRLKEFHLAKELQPVL
jgi:tRNA pseudouridine32 synthase/23S rRNA pseudouridine746 synthase